MYPHQNPPYPNNQGFVPPGSHNPGIYPPGVPSQPGYPPQTGYPSPPGYPSVPYPSAAAPAYPPTPNYPYPSAGPSPPYPGGQYAPQLGFPNSSTPVSPPGPGYPVQPPLAGIGQQSYYPPAAVPASFGSCPAPGQNFGATSGSGYVQQQHASNTGYSPSQHYPAQSHPQATQQVYSQSQAYPQTQAYPNLQSSSSPAQSKSPSKMATSQQYYETPTIREGPYDPMADAAALRKAMKGFGTDEKAIINVLARRTNNQRLQIANSFKASFGKDLLSDLKSECSGKFEDVLVALMTPRYDYMAQRLHSAISGIGTKEMRLIDILCSSSNQDLRWIQAAYARLYSNPLENDIIADTSGHFRRLLVSLCTAQRGEDTHVDMGSVHQDAQAMYAAGVKKWGTDESVFNMVMATRSYSHLREVFHEYEKVSGQDIERTINSEFSGDVKDALSAIVKSVKNRASYFAQRLHDAMKGMGTNDDSLIFILVTRCEVDLENIKQEYQRLYTKTLAEDIKGDTSGDYQKILVALCG